MVRIWPFSAPFEETGTGKIWTIDVAHGNPARFTPAGNSNEFSKRNSGSNGTRIAFVSERAIFERNTSGNGDSVPLAKSDQQLRTYGANYATGRFLKLQNVDRADLWLLPLSDADKTPIYSLGQIGSNLAFSPDGRFVAYDSTESGGREIYVRGLLESGHLGAGKWRISNGGGRVLHDGARTDASCSTSRGSSRR